AHRGGEGRGRARHHDGVEGLPQPRFRAAQAGAQDAGHLRRPQPVRARRGALAGPRVPPDRTPRLAMSAVSLPDFTRARVLIVGDVMLDRYWFGDVNRISPEAPVPVVHVKRTEERPGGAANVARNITALDGNATLLSVVGDDEAARTLDGLLKREKVRA